LLVENDFAFLLRNFSSLCAETPYLVSEDKHLLDLKKYQGIKIMNREQFAVELDRLGMPK
jgi:predicted nucleic acid-binding protein